MVATAAVIIFCGSRPSGCRRASRTCAAREAILPLARSAGRALRQRCADRRRFPKRRSVAVSGWPLLTRDRSTGTSSDQASRRGRIRSALTIEGAMQAIIEICAQLASSVCCAERRCLHRFGTTIDCGCSPLESSSCCSSVGTFPTRRSTGSRHPRIGDRGGDATSKASAGHRSNPLANAVQHIVGPRAGCGRSRTAGVQSRCQWRRTALPARARPSMLARAVASLSTPTRSGPPCRAMPFCGKHRVRRARPKSPITRHRILGATRRGDRSR